MAYDLSVKQFLGNAPGFLSRQVAPRYMIKDQLFYNFTKLYKEKSKSFSIKVFRKESDYYRVWIKVPSSKNNVLFDVIFDLKFDTGRSHIINGKMSVFSNSPAWIFTYAYVFNQNDVIPDDLKDFVSDKALTEAPEVSNSTEQFGFEKVTYFAMLYMQQILHIQSKYSLLKYVTKEKENWSEVKNLQSDEKLAEYGKATAEHREIAKVEKAKEAAERKAELVKQPKVDGQPKSSEHPNRLYANGIRVSKSSSTKTRVSKKPRTGRK